MQILSEYHLIEEREVVLVVPLASLTSSVNAWLLPRDLFEHFNFNRRSHIIHKELQKYEVNETIQRVLGLL